MFGVTFRISFGTCFFNIFLQYLFFIVNDANATSYANDNTSSFVDTNIHDFISRFNISWKACSQWFNQNQKKANLGKCHFISSSDVNIIREKKKLPAVLEKSFDVYFLKLIWDSNQSYLQHAAALKLYSLCRVISYMVSHVTAFF